jgi:mono/diheme cytochrome c family protein
MKWFINIFRWAAILLLLAGCYRGEPSTRPPIHLNPNMNDQPKYKAQAPSQFFTDSSAMRLPVEGTVARGDLRADDAFYRGKNKDGTLLKKNPRPLTMELLYRGRERFNIYCSPCHDRSGSGQGIVVQKGFLPPPTFHQARLREVEDGHIFDVISHGLRNMPSYRHQIPVADRWAIVAYVRALQLSQNARLQDIPPEMRDKIK